ncbi:hypothetical protein BY458DRAFT_555102 [Sporodiniella umbellata]|nr:hypothetical protein BY458DRAFT_555102 [Sporodiniella umbellata]
MGAQMVDYRVSAIVVLCKDCGNDVGLYPARHKCTPIDRPPMPPLPLNFSDSSNSNEVTTPSTPAPSMWASFRSKSVEPTTEKTEDSIYFNNFAQNLPNANDSSQSGKKLWGKVRQNDKWKQLSEKNEKSKQTGKLWEKLIQSTQAVHDDRGAESDEDDWDGETHVSRILREHYEKERLPLPTWLFDQYARNQTSSSEAKNYQKTDPNSPSSQTRLHDTDHPKREMSSRERERLELRQQQPIVTDTCSEFRQNSPSISYNNNDYRMYESAKKPTNIHYENHYDDRRNKEYYHTSEGNSHSKNTHLYSEQQHHHYNRQQQRYPVYQSQKTTLRSQNGYEKEAYGGYSRAEEGYASYNSSSAHTYKNNSASPYENIRLDTRRAQHTATNGYSSYL